MYCHSISRYPFARAWNNSSHMSTCIFLKQRLGYQKVQQFLL